MTKLAETYIHLNIEASQEFIKESEEFLHHFAQLFSSEIFEQDTRIYIRYESGSWKTWVTVAGAIYIGIGQYGSFRSGIDYLLKDSKRFSNAVIENFVEKEKIDESLIYRTERRLGIPGKIQRLFKRIDKLKSYNQTDLIDHRKYPWGKSNSEVERPKTFPIDNEIKNIKHEIIQIFKTLEHEEDKNLFVGALSETVSIIELPAPMRDLNGMSSFNGFPRHQSIGQFDRQIISKSDSSISSFDGVPLSETPSFPSNDILLQHREAVIREDDEVEILKQIINSSNFQIKIG
ncbi:hypothetical protein ACFL2E_05065 [Thermodesulfobacteriota bacterium]